MPPPHERHYYTTDHDVGSPTNPLPFLGQDYKKLLHQSLRRKKLYIDELFPPNSRSIGTLDKETDVDYKNIKWKRPSELVSKPCFTVDGISRFDYKQGSKLGNCWFLASIGTLTSTKDIINQVIPADQSFRINYAGIFHFRFWRFGKWIDVVVDDRLPTIDDDLLFVHSKTSNEFWPALLEKAYAKVCGSYADLDGGFISEALMDFTGGVHIQFALNEAPSYLWNIMYRAAKSKTLMGCSTYHGGSREAVSSNGIVGGHAYTVTGVSQVMSKGNPVHLVRVLNPWGKTEWNGDWSDGSSLWNTVSVKDSKWREKLDNGEFWLALIMLDAMKDFTKNFKTLDICCLCPDFLDRSPGCHWKSQRNFGKWIAGTTAGGSIDNTETFWKNPQFRVRIEKLSEDCTHEEGAENTLVSLMQNHEKRNRSSQKKKNYMIGFYVFKMRGESGKFSAEFFRDKRPVAITPFDGLREVMEFLWLEPGENLIVPCTKNPGESASFVLSIFSKHETHFEYIEETEENEDDP
ncbi:calpain-1 catalytic subunit-like [Rhinichthys klamathensis goyatoka]|uniref:calpain-1 catalytic subunit-like n=1 Tax=Rhinichthys klamathensis goyatoka TaxID=3034132 RepID=UPI0024B5E203|nr:calpain-1 catalytic subunit-like [Rhinichthys klamathensis goyatoka]